MLITDNLLFTLLNKNLPSNISSHNYEHKRFFLNDNVLAWVSLQEVYIKCNRIKGFKLIYNNGSRGALSAYRAQKDPKKPAKKPAFLG